MAGTRNLLLAALSGSDAAVMAPLLENVTLLVGDQLQEPDKQIEHAYFVDDGRLSIIAGSGARDSIEVAMVGREGMAGVPLLVNCDQSDAGVLVSRAGRARRIASAHLLRSMELYPSIRQALSPFSQVLSLQMSETARSSARRTVAERVARWILMAADRGESNNVFATHDELAVALGVRRPGVTVALHVLEGNHLVRARRGHIEVADRAGLITITQGTYGRPAAQYARLYPTRMVVRLEDREMVTA